MQKVTSYKKLSKKKQKELNAKKRKNWGELKPTVRVVESKKHYSRKRKARIDNDESVLSFFIKKSPIST